MTEKTTYRAMLSGTYVELVEHRRAVTDAMVDQHLLPLAMDFDAALPDKDLIEASLAKVNAADAYVGLISYRYGQAPESATRNPKKLSLTELEYELAVERRIPKCMFIMHPEHPVRSEEVHKEHGNRRKLKAFIKRVKADCIYAEFRSIDDLKAKAVQSLVKLREALDARAVGKLLEPAEAPATGGTALPLRETVVTPPARCIGRDDDAKSLVDVWMADSSSIAVLVLGGAGMGKTTITREAASRPETITKFGQRRWFVELETSPNAESLEKAIIVALGLDPASARLDTALARLGEASGLLVLDNLETPWDGEREKVEAVLASLHRVPRLALLASIRGTEAPAGVRWTRRRTMHPLEAPHDAEMFLDIATDIKAEDPDLAPLLTLLGGVPIAIELVAQQAEPHKTLAAVHAEWQRVGSTLARRRGVASSSKLSSLDVSLELSFQSQRLTDAGRRLFCILGQLPAGIAPEDVKALLGDAAFEARQQLLSTALAVERGDRLDLLPPIRDHAIRHHPPTTKDAGLWRAHYLSLARDVGEKIGMAEGATAMERLAPELANLDAAQRATLLAGETAVAASSVRGVVRLMRYTGLGTGATINAIAAACRVANNAGAEAICFENLADLALNRSDHETARKACEQALLLYRQVRDILGEANCIISLGDVALHQSDHETARKAYEQALPLYRQVRNIIGEAHCIKSLGDIALDRSDYEAARKSYEQALPIYQQVGQILGEANCTSRLGDIALNQSDHEIARKAYDKALPLYQKVGDLIGEANCIQSLGDIALHRSDHEAARKAYEQALPLYRQVGAILGEANCVHRLGDIARANANNGEARKLYEQALALFQRFPDPYSVGFGHYCLASLTEGAVRAAHRAAAKQAWLSIGREDLIEKAGLSDA